MPITTEHIQKLSKLARIELNDDTLPVMTVRLSQLLKLIQTMQTVDTEGIPPLIHPASFMQQAALPLREDIVLLEEAKSAESKEEIIAQRNKRMLNAPATQDGYFLVPRVLE